MQDMDLPRYGIDDSTHDGNSIWWDLPGQSWISVLCILALKQEPNPWVVPDATVLVWLMHVRSSSQPGVSELCVGVLTVKHLPCFHGRKDVLLFSTYSVSVSFHWRGRAGN